RPRHLPPTGSQDTLLTPGAYKCRVSAWARPDVPNLLGRCQSFPGRNCGLPVSSEKPHPDELLHARATYRQGPCSRGIPALTGTSVCLSMRLSVCLPVCLSAC